MIEKIKEIVASYATMLNPTDEQKEIAEKRLAICMDCEFWSNNLPVQVCTKCGCATKAKVFSPRGAGACPENKWVE